MITKEITSGIIRLSVPYPWDDVSADLAIDDPPITVARVNEDSGVLQFSPARFTGGRHPEISASELRSMIEEFGVSRNLGDPFDERVQNAGIFVAASSFRSGGDFIRVWYVSDGLNLALVTYVGDLENHRMELPECEQMVASLVFIQEDAVLI